MKVERQPPVLLLHHLLSFETRSLIGQNFTTEAKLAYQKASGICFSLTPITGDSSAQHYGSFVMACGFWGSELKFSCLQGDCFTGRAIFLALLFFFFLIRALFPQWGALSP